MSYPHGNYYNDSYYNRPNHPHYYNNNRSKYNNYPHNKHYRGGYNKKNYNYDEGYSKNMPPKFNQLTMNLEEAIAESSIPENLSDLRDFIKDFLIKYHSNNEEAEIYLTTVEEEERIFVIEQILNIPFNNKNYKITILIYLPILFPNYEAEFYISNKKGGVCIVKSYEESINQEDLRINLNCFCPLEKDNKNLEEILDNIKKQFMNEFPIYKGNEYNYNEQKGKCFLNRKCSYKILFDNLIQKSNYNNIIEDKEEDKKEDNFNNINFNEKEENFDDISFMEFMKIQVKDILREKYFNFIEANHPEGNYDILKKIDKNIKNKKDKNMGSNIEQLNEEKAKLNKIKKDLVLIEKELIQENEQIKNSKKTVFDKSDELIKVKNHKLFELIIMKKTLEDYLIFLKKGFEKKVLSFEDMITKTRSFSRELFNINYSINKLKDEI